MRIGKKGNKGPKAIINWLRILVAVGLIVFVSFFVLMEQRLQNENCLCDRLQQSLPASTSCETIGSINGFKEQHRDDQKQILKATAEPSIRSVALHLLQTLPNNTTQREISHATIRYLRDGNLTLVTQAGVPKLPRLLDLASRWQGPISCAIYITTIQQLDDWLKFQENDREGLISKYVTFHLLIEQPQMPEKVNRHPVNRLRNLALRNVDTEFVFLNDIDFIPTIQAYDKIAPRLKDLPTRMFWVLPAFERFGSNPRRKGGGQTVDDVALIPKTKDALTEAVSESVVAPFHEYFKAGHGPTNYPKWYSANDPYVIEYDYLYEPYVICRTEGLPSFFPSFRGFAFNKMSFFMEAHYLGFKFTALPDLFVVHMNHGGRKGRNDKGGNSHLVKQDFRMYLQRIYGVSNATLNKWK